MELPFHLKTIEPLPGALDILRFFGTLEEETADADTICDTLDLSDRRFSKAIRRLVTKGYLVMDGDMIYRLTEQGQDAVEELAEYDGATGDSSAAPAPSTSANQVTRRMILAVPNTLIAQQSANILLGFHPGDSDVSTEVVARVSVLNGEPSNPHDAIFSLGKSHAHEAVSIVPGSFDQVRIKVEVFQLGDNPGDIDAAGGMYIDVPVVAQPGSDDTNLVAYGTDIQVTA